jgi:hypothetical protein
MVCWASVASAEPINAVVGDESWVAAHGEEPVEGVDGEVARIQTHLRFVIERLRAGSEVPLGDAQRARRLELLDALEVYAVSGVFPQRIQGDGWGVRRPQFIDSRGVHCAVGELIRVSGHAELARSLDAEHEFNYVADMDSPELLAWAAHHGFSPRELAMIQPGYSAPPNVEMAERMLRDRADDVVWACSAEGPPTRYIKVRVRGDSEGNVTTTLIQPRNAFTECAVGKMKLRFGGAWDGSPQVFNRAVRVALPSGQELMEERLQNMGFFTTSSKCLPGDADTENPKEVAVRVVSNRREARVDVKTTPPMPEVQACIAAYVGEQVGLRKADWQVDASRTREVRGHVHDAQVASYMKYAAPQAASACWASGAPESGTLEVTARASRVDQAFAIEVDGGTPEYAACVGARLKEELAKNFERSYQRADGTWERKLVIDADASASTSFTVEAPEAREERLKKERERMKRELERHKYEMY